MSHSKTNSRPSKMTSTVLKEPTPLNAKAVKSVGPLAVVGGKSGAKVFDGVFVSTQIKEPAVDLEKATIEKQPSVRKRKFTFEERLQAFRMGQFSYSDPVANRAMEALLDSDDESDVENSGALVTDDEDGKSRDVYSRGKWLF